MRVVIFDPVNPRPYSLETLQREPLGGAEASVVRLAEPLDAIVVQHNRTESDGRFRAASTLIEPTHLIVLRVPSAAIELMQRYPTAKKFLWMHDLAGAGTEPGWELTKHAVELASLRVTIVCGSDFQAAEIRRNFSALPQAQSPKVRRIYLPVVVPPPQKHQVAYDPNKLVFFSSPHKGLDYTRFVFSYLHSRIPDLRLYIANPGYRFSTVQETEGVINLGSIPQRAIVEHVRSALCTFYPNYVYPETFGLVLAESNTVGTPVITHAIGSAPEVLRGDDQFLPIPKIRRIADPIFRRLPDIRERGEQALAGIGCFDRYWKKVVAWQAGARPLVSGRPEFALGVVVAAWRQLLGCDAHM